MASASGDSWSREYNEATKLAEDVSGVISANESESQRHFSTARRTLTILATRIDSLDALLCKLPTNQTITEKELNRRKDMLSNLRAKTMQMGSALSMSSFARDSLLGPEIKPVDAMTRVAGLDNQGVVIHQRQLIKEQDEGLENLEESVISTKHIALAVNEELELQTELIDKLDFQVEVTESRLQRLGRSLGILSTRIKGSCSCLCLSLSVAGIVILILVVWVLIKYL